MRISPAVGARKPAMTLSSVDLPQPEGPTMHRNSEASMSKLTPATPLPGGRVVDERDVADFDMGHDLRAAVIDGMRLCGQTRAIPRGESFARLEFGVDRHRRGRTISRKA